MKKYVVSAINSKNGEIWEYDLLANNEIEAFAKVEAHSNFHMYEPEYNKIEVEEYDEKKHGADRNFRTIDKF